MQDGARLEGVSISLLRGIGSPDPPMDAFQLAAACGFRVTIETVPSVRRGDGLIVVPNNVHVVLQHELVAHELGRWALERAGMPCSKDAAEHVGDALMLPGRELLGFPKIPTVTEILARHPFANVMMICRRIVAVRRAYQAELAAAPTLAR